MSYLQLFDFIVTSIIECYTLAKKDIFHDSHKLIAARIVETIQELYTKNSSLFDLIVLLLFYRVRHLCL